MDFTEADLLTGYYFYRNDNLAPTYGILRPLLHRLGVENAHSRPRTEIVESYWQIIRRVHDDAGSAAVIAFLESKRG